ncbi:trpE operon leader peptide TrpLE [Sinorhizobium fredii]|uniref:trpE operon leader peptide TrpLE n=1 Tax=Rhizobium fredii TaxID=380 RepID=UPI0032B5B27B
MRDGSQGPPRFLSDAKRSDPCRFSRLRGTASHANTSPMANTQNISIWWWAR